MPGALFVVATPIGNLEDITLRALRVLREVDLIAAEDTRRTARLLAHYGITTSTTSLHEHNEPQKSRRLVERMTAGERVALVSDAGLPGLSDPGAGLVRHALHAGIQVEVIPGASALTTALAGSGWPLETVLFAGFPPSRAGERLRWLRRFGQMTGVLAFFEAPHRLSASLAAMEEVFGDAEVVVAHELTKLHESWHRGRISSLRESGTLPNRGEFTILVFNRGRQDEPGRRATAGEQAGAISSLDIFSEFGRLTENEGLSRHDALAALARRFGLPRRAIFAAVESHKHSGD